jgi:hypothetical protein
MTLEKRVVEIEKTARILPREAMGHRPFPVEETELPAWEPFQIPRREVTVLHKPL